MFVVALSFASSCSNYTFGRNRGSKRGILLNRLRLLFSVFSHNLKRFQISEPSLPRLKTHLNVIPQKKNVLKVLCGREEKTFIYCKYSVNNKKDFALLTGQ